MIGPLDIIPLERVWDLFYNHGDEYNRVDLDDLAHWLGERAGLMLQEIRILRTQVESLQAALEERGWIPVGEQLPEDWEKVLTYCPDQYPRFRITLQQYEECGVNGLAWWLGGGQNYVLDEGSVTHWMPLPLEVDE